MFCRSSLSQHICSYFLHLSKYGSEVFWFFYDILITWVQHFVYFLNFFFEFPIYPINIEICVRELQVFTCAFLKDIFLEIPTYLSTLYLYLIFDGGSAANRKKAIISQLLGQLN